MKNNNSQNLQYNSCISKGICSVNPRTSSLQNVVGLYMHMCAKYGLKLFNKNSLDNSIKNFILNTTAITVANNEFSEECFMSIIAKLKTILPDIIKKYNQIYEQSDFEGEDILSSDIFRKCENITDAIKLGENIFKKNLEQLSSEERDLYKIIFLIAKSLSINLLYLEGYDADYKPAVKEVLFLLSSLNKENSNVNILKKIIIKAVKCNIEVIKELYNEQVKRYGEQEINDVSYTTTPAKAVLTVGSNIRELEIILESLKDECIDIYTHDEMMIAHTFPKFKDYKNLKGQYGYGYESCLIDFATFPGPIILTKHSLHNIENLYRGRLFTTDNNFYKGVIKIENNDFTEVIKSANEAKGFKKGKVCETVKIGYNFEKTIDTINKKIDSNVYKKIFIIGEKEFSDEYKNYFETMVKLLPENVLIISFSNRFTSKNTININTCFDSFALLRFFDNLKDYSLPINIFITECRRNTVSEIIYYTTHENVKVFLGDCQPIMLNPSLMQTLINTFGINKISTAKNDLKNIS